MRGIGAVGVRAPQLMLPALREHYFSDGSREDCSEGRLRGSRNGHAARPLGLRGIIVPLTNQGGDLLLCRPTTTRSKVVGVRKSALLISVYVLVGAAGMAADARADLRWRRAG